MTEQETVRAALSSQHIEQLWAEHLKGEFESKDVEATLATMVEDAYVNHMPVNTGIENARMEAKAIGLSNATFEVVDVTNLPAEPKFDLITAFDAIHDQKSPDSCCEASIEHWRQMAPS